MWVKNPQQAYTRQLLGAIPILKGAKSAPLMGERFKGWEKKTKEAGA
jgi:ABC-type dipeptide/oligopeptide/nickel transport system ATPase component